MTVADSLGATACAWRALLPADREFVALPHSSRPVIVAERDSAVLGYVREAMLARPPHSRLPGWAYESARLALRVPGAWTLAPRLAPSAGSGRDPDEVALANWIAGSRHRLIVLDHSHDPDRRFILLLLPAGASEPVIAVKVATCAAAAVRIETERERLRLLADAPLGEIRGTMPSLVDVPATVTLPVLAMTARPGTPMLVASYRGGRSAGSQAVGSHFAAAQDWLTTLQSVPTGGPVRLDVAQTTVDAAERQLGGSAADLRSVRAALGALRGRLQAYRAASTVVHGDFWSGNILLRDGRVSGVVDWERAEPVGSPIRDLGRFATGYSMYLDRQTRPGRPVSGCPGLIAGAPEAGLRYALTGAGWYPRVVGAFLDQGLRRLGLPGCLGPDVMLAELAAIAAEATDLQFGVAQWRVFAQLCEGRR
ncbi:MAG TPA: aminoglycoside phosphotransferase family protein [Mycobacteriales bacterium]|nr:aminoglycoside phosphotransferase family protein [Mycobacteriales bacterium]